MEGLHLGSGAASCRPDAGGLPSSCGNRPTAGEYLRSGDRGKGSFRNAFRAVHAPRFRLASHQKIEVESSPSTIAALAGTLLAAFVELAGRLFEGLAIREQIGVSTRSGIRVPLWIALPQPHFRISCCAHSEVVSVAPIRRLALIYYPDTTKFRLVTVVCALPGRNARPVISIQRTKLLLTSPDLLERSARWRTLFLVRVGIAPSLL